MSSTSDNDAAEAVFALHGREALRLALLLCDDRIRAEEAASEAVARVWDAWRRGKVRDVRPYLRRAVVNQVRNSFRRRRVELREGARRHGDSRGLRSHEDQFADREAFRSALQRLPQRQRAAIVLRYYEDLSEAETAEVLDCRVGTVKSQVSRGLVRLRSILETDTLAIKSKDA